MNWKSSTWMPTWPNFESTSPHGSSRAQWSPLWPSTSNHLIIVPLPCYLCIIKKNIICMYYINWRIWNSKFKCMYAFLCWWNNFSSCLFFKMKFLIKEKKESERYVYICTVRPVCMFTFIDKRTVVIFILIHFYFLFFSQVVGKWFIWQDEYRFFCREGVRMSIVVKQRTIFITYILLIVTISEARKKGIFHY